MIDYNICIVGLGYVGLPLAAAFAEKYSVMGFDINEKRISELKEGFDQTLELDNTYLKSILKSKIEGIGLLPTNNIQDIKKCDFFIITVPTPIDDFNNPDLTPLIKASELIGKILKKGDTVVYESTVYPGATEEICIPVLERVSGLKLNKDFAVGYSPERINPGDKEHTVKKIKKVTSGSSPKAAKEINALYENIITAGTFSATSIKVAEAAKVIENSQRDLNIAFVNELSKIFRILEIDTNDVLRAAATKWNFLSFQPGLVGGHCIGVDPYYLAQKAQNVGYHPEIILSGRRLNDSMGKYVASETIKIMIKKNHTLPKSKILILGFTFKENCPDFRNTKVIDIYHELLSYHAQVEVYDPWINIEEVQKEYDINIIPELGNVIYDTIILAVPHREFKTINWRNFMVKNGVLFDVKGILNKEHSDGRL